RLLREALGRLRRLAGRVERRRELRPDETLLAVRRSVGEAVRPDGDPSRRPRAARLLGSEARFGQRGGERLLKRTRGLRQILRREFLAAQFEQKVRHAT